jgi:hypothetical protein
MVKGIETNISQHSAKKKDKYSWRQVIWQIVLSVLLVAVALFSALNVYYASVGAGQQSCTASGIHLVADNQSLPVLFRSSAKEEADADAKLGCIFALVTGVVVVISVPAALELLAAIWRKELYTNTKSVIDALTKTTPTKLKDITARYIDLHAVYEQQNAAWVNGLTGEVSELSQWMNKLPPVGELVHSALASARRVPNHVVRLRNMIQVC